MNTKFLNDWKTYLQWNILKSTFCSYLSKSFVDASFNNQVVSGQRTAPLGSHVITLNGSIEVAGAVVCKEYFTPATKFAWLSLINLRKAFAVRINNLDWMVQKRNKHCEIGLLSSKLYG
jgi:putative endopeptidase